MLHRHRKANLADEATDELGAGGELRQHDLERPDVAGDAVLRAVDRPHASVTNEGEDLEGAEERPRREARTRGVTSKRHGSSIS